MYAGAAECRRRRVKFQMGGRAGERWWMGRSDGNRLDAAGRALLVSSRGDAVQGRVWRWCRAVEQAF